MMSMRHLYTLVYIGSMKNKTPEEALLPARDALSQCSQVAGSMVHHQPEQEMGCQDEVLSPSLEPTSEPVKVLPVEHRKIPQEIKTQNKHKYVQKFALVAQKVKCQD